jgi:hypothetical protein
MRYVPGKATVRDNMTNASNRLTMFFQPFTADAELQYAPKPCFDVIRTLIV